MSIVNLFTREQPKINGFEIDAILEDTFEASVDFTGYTVEVGARPADSRIINPVKWTLTGAVSNNPLGTSVTDFLGAVVPDSAIGSTIAGLGAGLLSGGDDTRAGTALDKLVEFMNSGVEFDVDTGDRTLKNMTIVKITRTRDPENEEALIFIAELSESPRLEATLARMPGADILADGDPAKSQASALSNKGELTGSTPSSGIMSSITGLF